MDKLEYEGQIYYRTTAKWTDDRHLVVHESLQRKLNQLYLEAADTFAYSVEDLLREGDKLKESGSYEAAIKFYEKAEADCDERTLSYILPRISSCYRHCHMAEKAINLFSRAKSKYGEDFITPVLLTSVAAAYCDLREYENALLQVGL